MEEYKREILKFTNETTDVIVLKQLYSFIYSYKKRKMIKNQKTLGQI